MLFAIKKLCALSKQDFGILGAGHKDITTQTKQFYYSMISAETL